MIAADVDSGNLTDCYCNAAYILIANTISAFRPVYLIDCADITISDDTADKLIASDAGDLMDCAAGAAAGLVGDIDADYCDFRQFCGWIDLY